MKMKNLDRLGGGGGADVSDRPLDPPMSYIIIFVQTTHVLLLKDVLVELNWVLCLERYFPPNYVQ